MREGGVLSVPTDQEAVLKHLAAVRVICLGSGKEAVVGDQDELVLDLGEDRLGKFFEVVDFDEYYLTVPRGNSG